MELSKSTSDFSSFNLDERIVAGLSKAGYTFPTSVQLKSIPLCQTGRDVFVQGKSGSGKTFVLSILALAAVLEAEDLQVLILTPTREGALQIYNTIITIGSEVKDLKCELFIGGLFSYTDSMVKAEKCQIAVGTGGRIGQLLCRNHLQTDSVCLFLVDDFDEMMDDSLLQDINEIFHTLPERKQTVFTSLTSSKEVIESASKYLKHSFLSCICDADIPYSGMDHYYHIVPVSYLKHLVYRKKLQILNDILFNVQFSQCIIFSRSALRIQMLSVDVRKWGLSVASISKAKDQTLRFQVVENFKKKMFDVLISTDISTVGFDAENVDLVINFEVPPSYHSYLRRCGLAGRKGGKCLCITFLEKYQQSELIEIEKEGHFKNHELPVPVPEEIIYDLYPSKVRSLPDKLSSDYKSKENLVSSSTKSAEGCSPLTADKIDDACLEVEECSVLNAKKTEEQAAVLKNVETNLLNGDSEVTKVSEELTEDYPDTSKCEAMETSLLMSCEENTELPGIPENFNINQLSKNSESSEYFNKVQESENCLQSSYKTTQTCKYEATGECSMENEIISSDFEVLSNEYDSGGACNSGALPQNM